MTDLIHPDDSQCEILEPTPQLDAAVTRALETLARIEAKAERKREKREA